MIGKKQAFLVGALLSVLATGTALAAGLFTNGVPQAGGSQYPSTLPLTGNELVPADTQLTNGQNPASEAISTAQLAANTLAQPSRGNALIGGDATTNLWQRGTAGTAATVTVAYNSADRWASWSGTGTEIKLIRDSTAGDLPTGYQYAFKLQRTSGQTGVVQACMAQEVESVNSYQFAGSTAELDFHAFTGANFSGASANMTAYIITGTGTDEGMATLAHGLNGGGGGSSAWAGQANAAAAVTNLGAVSTAGRYAAVAKIPAGTTEIAVALCWTPVGTAGTNDYIAFDGIQLIRNPANASYASATVGYSDVTFPAASFERRPQGVETALQQRYYYKLNDPAATAQVGQCQVITANTAAVCNVPLPVTMRTTATITAPGSNTAFAITAADGTANVCTALAVTGSSTVPQPGGQIQVTCTPTSNIAITVPSKLIGDAQAFFISASAEL